MTDGLVRLWEDRLLHNCAAGDPKENEVRITVIFHEYLNDASATKISGW